MTATPLLQIDGLKRSLRIIDTGDTAVDSATDALLTVLLKAAENYVQSAIGTDIDGFYASDDILPVYQVACYALATAYFQNPSAIVTGTTANPVNLVLDSIIGQLRGRYATAQQAQQQQEGSDTNGTATDTTTP